MARLLYSRYWPTTQRLLPFIVLALYVMSILVTALLFSWLDDQFVRYALACVVVQTVSLLLLTAGLVAGKIIATRWNDRRQERIDQISDLMAQFSSGAENQVQLLETASAHSSEFLEVWEASLTRLKGSCRLRVEGLLHETGLDRVLVSRLGDRDPGRVLFAISLLRKLDNPSMEATEKALAHPSDVVRMAARITLAARGSRQAQERVLRELPRLPFWQRVVLFQQIPDDSPALCEYLAGLSRPATTRPCWPRSSSCSAGSVSSPSARPAGSLARLRSRCGSNFSGPYPSSRPTKIPFSSSPRVWMIRIGASER